MIGSSQNLFEPMFDAYASDRAKIKKAIETLLYVARELEAMPKPDAGRLDELARQELQPVVHGLKDLSYWLKRGAQ
jgi:hypothetical protein